VHFLKTTLTPALIIFASLVSYAQCVPQPPPDPIDISRLGRTLTFSSASINSGGNFATIAPGAAFSVSFDFRVSANITACPGCITYFYVGVAGTLVPGSPSTTTYPNTDCIGSLYGGQTGSYVSSFTAPSTPGYYYITTDATWTYWCHQYAVYHDNCISDAIALIVVGNPPPMTVALDSVKNISVCGGNDGGIFITPTGGAGCYLYSWSSGGTAQDLTNVFASSYSVTISDGGCDTVLSAIVNDPGFGFLLPNDTALCIGDSLLLNAGIVDSVIWQDGSHALSYSVTITGTYWATAFSGLCTEIDTINVIFNSHPTPSLGNDTAICEGSLMLNAGAGYDIYLWQDSSQASSFSATSSGIYWAEVSLNSCTGRDSAVITFDSLPVVELGNDTIVCEGDVLSLDATSPSAFYNWQDGSANPVYPVSTSGTYSVTVTKGVCSMNDSVTITVNQFPSVNLNVSYLLCGDDTIILDVSSSGSSYQWQDGATQAVYDVTSGGTYSVSVSNGPCETADTAEVTAELLPQVNLGVDVENCVGKIDITLDASFDGANYLWQDNSTAATFTAKTAGVYSVSVNNQCGTASDSISINVKDCGCKVGFPSAFSPNGDGKNDFFKPLAGCAIGNFRLLIFNRWGEKIFETSDTKLGWDGAYKDALQDLGVYMWYAEYSIPNGNGGVFKSVKESGSVILIQ